MKHTKFEVFQDKAGEYRWYLRAGNGEIVADSAEGYVNKRSALHGIDLIRELNPKTVTFQDLTTGAEAAQVEPTGGKRTKFEVFQDKAGEYRWYLRAGNGEIIADSAEGYVNKRSALHGIDLIKGLNPKTVTFEDLTAKAAAATTATAEATAVVGMTAEPAPTAEVTTAPPAAEASMATEVAMEPAKDTRVRSSVIILVVAAVIIVGIIATGFALGLL